MKSKIPGKQKVLKKKEKQKIMVGQTNKAASSEFIKNIENKIEVEK